MYPRKRALERIAREKVLYARQPGGDISVCVIYPNTYRLGIKKNSGATGDDQRKIAAYAIGAASRNPGHAQNAQNVEIVGLEGNRECEDVEVGERTSTLERDEALATVAE